MAISPNITALNAYAGKYEKQIFSKLFNALDAINDLTLIQDVKNKLTMTKLTAGNGARPYSSTFQPRGADLKYTNRVLEVLQAKRDLCIEPSKYRATWMSEQMKPGVNTLDIPFAQYVWDQVMTELAAELNDKTIFNGFDKADAVAYDALATYAPGDYITFDNNENIDYYLNVTATTAGQSPSTHPAKWQDVNAEAICIGFAKRIADAITASELAPVATGAIAASTAYAQFTEMWRSMPVAYQRAGANIYCSFDNMHLLVDDYEDKVGKFTMDDTKVLILPKTAGKCKIIPATWMGDSGRLIVTPKENLLIGTDRISDINKMTTEPHLRTLDVGIDFALGTQIRDLDAIRVSDVA